MTRRPWISSSRSAAENGFDPARFSTRLLDWREPARRTVPDHPWCRRDLRGPPGSPGRRLLDRLLAPGGVGLLASPYRVAAKGFPAALAAVGLTCQTEAATARSEDGRSDRRDDLSRHALTGVLSTAIRPERADDLADVGHPGVVEPAGQIIEQALGRGRVVEGGGADLDGRGAGDQELEGVVGRGDPADADDRQLGQGAGDVPDHPQGDRLDRRPGEAADVIGQDRPPPSASRRPCRGGC